MKTQSFEMGLADYHHMIYLILKTKIKKSEPTMILKISTLNSLNWIICNSMNNVKVHSTFENNFVSKINTLLRNQNITAKSNKNLILGRTFENNDQITHEK